MHQAHFPPSFPPGPGRFHESNSSLITSSLSQGRPAVPVRVGAPPVSGRQASQASGSSTPGTATSGRAGSTGPEGYLEPAHRCEPTGAMRSLKRPTSASTFSPVSGHDNFVLLKVLVQEANFGMIWPSKGM
eukprot:s528_g29.t1